jgi:L-ascorbate metabolism protein UlaG (beta-lactamase superfamily)
MNTQIQLLGHATLKITTPENRILLVDPWLNGNDFIPKPFRNQDVIDLIVITHGHEDHFDKFMPDLIDKTKATVIANSIVRFYLYEHFVDKELIEPMNLGGTIFVKDVTITMVHAQHLGHIMIERDSIGYTHPSVGFVLQFSDGVRLYIAGDTGIFSDMALIGELYHPQIAVLPIGGRYTMGSMEAAHAIRLLKVSHVIPYHYGTFESLTGTPEELKNHTADIHPFTIHALKAGEVLDCGMVLE